MPHTHVDSVVKRVTEKEKRHSFRVTPFAKQRVGVLQCLDLVLFFGKIVAEKCGHAFWNEDWLSRVYVRERFVTMETKENVIDVSIVMILTMLDDA